MHALQCPHGVDENLQFSFDLDLHITCFQCHVKLWYTWSILIDGYHLACSAQKSYEILTNYHVCIAHMIHLLLTSINLICSCFVHVQQHAPPRIAGAGHPCDAPITACYDRSLFSFCNTPLAKIVKICTFYYFLYRHVIRSYNGK